jgi:hypothetical protein
VPIGVLRTCSACLLKDTSKLGRLINALRTKLSAEAFTLEQLLESWYKILTTLPEGHKLEIVFTGLVRLLAEIQVMVAKELQGDIMTNVDALNKIVDLESGT